MIPVYQRNSLTFQRNFSNAPFGISVAFGPLVQALVSPKPAFYSPEEDLPWNREENSAHCFSLSFGFSP
jgi:hypothetical protein